ncbi:NAD(P)-dependent oxidoreductase [Methylobacterium nodulans]|uniref:6-phosphogluconate dehydrogenase NAD-binding n=1 Tax=Methylobacterium nodulans (strain LMG 21967 / CNCM I-2342 / ORS 2060) TaxID=460265 RepID=B8IBK1_METNO|nr:NAD(P)-dependent oxidoreductase [Methylobacterium nodulans]ACL59255.1 6-phosphogluconate dehydrogenase NAD-binding [Methylobacterium nodulans ORS 2060]
MAVTPVAQPPLAQPPLVFVGLGSMGLPMASNLVAKGFEVRGYDVRAESRAAFAKAGGVPADDLRQAASGAGALVLMVVNAAQAETVLFAEGALDALAPGAAVILMATCPPEAVARIAERVEAAGRVFVDAPVSGGVVGAEGGTLTVMAAAPAETFARVRPLLDAVGERIFHVGTKPGQGATVKAVNQLLCGVHIAAAAEALSLAEKVGVDLAVVLEILSGSSAASWMLRDRGPRMLEEMPRVTSAVDIFVKDLGIVLEAGRDQKAALPLASLAHQLFLAASGRGEGAADDSQVIRSYRVLNGHG